MWAVAVALKKSSSFNAPCAAMHGCEVGRAHWLIRWWRMSLSRGRWSGRTQTERPTPAVFSKTCWLTGSALTVFCLRPQGFQKCNWVCTASSHRSPGHCHHQRVRNFSDLCQRRTHLSTTARTTETEQLFVYECCQQIQFNIIDLSLLVELKVKFINESRREHAEQVNDL